MSVRAVVIAAIVLVGLAAAIDFTAMAPHKLTDLGDKHMQAEHSHHEEFTHPETGRKTFVHFDAKVDYHKKWNFVQLSEHAAPGVMGVHQRCHISSAARTTFSIKMKDEAAKQTVLSEIAKPQPILLARDLRCASRTVLGHYGSHVIDKTDSLNVTFHIVNAQFQDVFRNAAVKFHTNHFQHHVYTPEEIAEILRKWNNEKDGTTTARRHMEAQHWFHHFVHHIEHDASHVVHKVEHAATTAGKDIKKAYSKVSHAIQEVGNDVQKLCQKVEGIVTEAEDVLQKADAILNKIVNLAEGNLDVDKSFTLAKASWGTASLMSTYFTPAPTTTGYKVDHYGSFDLIVHFELDIKSYKVTNLLASIEGDAAAAIAASATGSYTASFSKQVADVRIPAINFAIGPVPVHIQPYIPVHVDFSVKAGASIQFGAQAKGSVTFGITYKDGKFGTIHDHTFSFTHKFTQPTAPQLSISASVTPSVVLQIDCIGGPIASIRIQADCNLVNNDELVITAQPVASISAQLKVAIKGHTILGPKTLGPYTKDGTVYHLATIKLPNLDPFGSKKRFSALETIKQNGNDAATAPSIGAIFRGARILNGVHTAATFQIIGGSNTTVDLMGVITSSSNTGFSTVISPYTMGMSEDGLVYLRANLSEAVGSTTAPELAVEPPSFEDVRITQGETYSTMELNDQVMGQEMAYNGVTFKADNRVYSSTAAAAAVADNSDAKHASTTDGSAKSSSSSGSNNKVAIYAGSGAALLGLMAVVAFVAVRATRKPAVRSAALAAPAAEVTEDAEPMV